MHYDNHFARPSPFSPFSGCTGFSALIDPDTTTGASGTRFRFFPRLPGEIRTMIWEYALPEARVYEVLDAPQAKQRTPAREGLMFANVHGEGPPALAAVCRESRYFVLHRYKPLTLGSTTKYVDLSRDILLLEPYLLVKRLHRTLHFMSKLPLVRDSITRLALGTSYGVYTGICHPVLSWRVSKGNMAKLLASLAKFPKLKELVFVVHQEFQFEFDLRFPGSLTPVPPGAVASLGSAAATSTGTLGGFTGRPGGGGNGGGSAVVATLSPLLPAPPRSLPPAISTGGSLRPLAIPPGLGGPRPGQNHLGVGASSVLTPPPSQQQQQQAIIAQPRPQLVHQAYRFKFDIEANINHAPQARPHVNELLYYPLDIDEDKEDWDLGEENEEGEWCDPWPTNDDWRRFRKRFVRAMRMVQLEAMGGQQQLLLQQQEQEQERIWSSGAKGSAKGVCGKKDTGSGSGSGGGVEKGLAGGKGGGKEVPVEVRIPGIKGASLLWRYTRGGYV